jgi:hypothetical protein
MTCDHINTKLVIRARERTGVWGTAQVVECRDCGHRTTE